MDISWSGALNNIGGPDSNSCLDFIGAQLLWSIILLYGRPYVKNTSLSYNVTFMFQMMNNTFDYYLAKIEGYIKSLHETEPPYDLADE